MIPVRGLNDANNSNQAPDFQSQVKTMWGNVPTFCRFLFITTIGIYLSSFIFAKVPAYLITQAYPIIYSLQLWRIFTGPFVHVQLLQLLFSLMSYLPTAMQQEKLDGTVKQAYRFFLHATLIEGLFVFVSFLFAMFVNPIFLMMPSIGLWPILFCDITIECNKSPEVARGLCCLPIQIKSKYYPWALLAIFTIFFGFQLDLFVGLGVGYMNIFNMLQRFELSTHRAKIWEAKMPFKKYASEPHFVPADGSAGLPTFVRTAPPQQNSQQRNSAPPSDSSQSSFKAFKGKGTTLGGDTQTQTTAKGKAKSTTGSEQSYGSLSRSSMSSASSSNTTTQDQQRSRSVLGQSALLDGSGNLRKGGNSGSNNLDDSVGHAIDKKGDQEYQKVRNNTDDGEEDLDINLK